MTDELSIGAAWRGVRDSLRAADFDTPELDARLLGEFAFDLDRRGLLEHEADPASADDLARLEGYAERRLAGEPVARILGHKEFYGLDFTLNDATLVPRPETELLVDVALAAIKTSDAPVVLDLGTGSGCVAIAILVNAPAARAIATDVSADAIDAARVNAEHHGVADRIEFRAGSWCAPLAEGERFDVVVSNPPYVETDIIEQLPTDVRDHDPVLALDGGEDGLAAFRNIVEGIAGHINPGGLLVVEVGSEQGLEVGALFANAGYVDIDIRKDLAGLDRVVLAHQI